MIGSLGIIELPVLVFHKLKMCCDLSWVRWNIKAVSIFFNGTFRIPGRWSGPKWDFNRQPPCPQNEQLACYPYIFEVGGRPVYPICKLHLGQVPPLYPCGNLKVGVRGLVFLWEGLSEECRVTHGSFLECFLLRKPLLARQRATISYKLHQLDNIWSFWKFWNLKLLDMFHMIVLFSSMEQVFPKSPFGK